MMRRSRVACLISVLAVAVVFAGGWPVAFASQPATPAATPIAGCEAASPTGHIIYQGFPSEESTTVPVVIAEPMGKEVGRLDLPYLRSAWATHYQGRVLLQTADDGT